MSIGTLRYALGNNGGFESIRLARAWRHSAVNPRDVLETEQSKKLMILLNAARQTPYWRSHLKMVMAKHSPRKVLAELPVLTKGIVRENGIRMLRNGRLSSRAKWCSTGGSTGEPLRLVRDDQTQAAGLAACLRGFSWLGLYPGMPTVLVKGYTKIGLLGALQLRLLNSRLVDPLGHDRFSPEKVETLLRRFRPRCLTGYPTTLLKLADMLKNAGLQVPTILWTGEMLYSDQRSRLEKVFGARVAGYYGSNEVNGIAFECEHGQRHVTEEHVILETVDENNQPVWETPGRILVTDLDNLAMPLIRYEIGDVGVLTRKTCTCGRSLLLLKEFQGRMQDLLRNHRGDVLPAIFFAGRFRNLRGLRSYQLVQQKIDAVQLNYVSEGPQADVEVEAICEAITHHLGSQMRIHRRACKAIPMTPRGKTRLVIGLNITDGAPSPAR